MSLRPINQSVNFVRARQAAERILYRAQLWRWRRLNRRNCRVILWTFRNLRGRLEVFESIYLCVRFMVLLKNCVVPCICTGMQACTEGHKASRPARPRRGPQVKSSLADSVIRGPTPRPGISSGTACSCSELTDSWRHVLLLTSYVIMALPSVFTVFTTPFD